jgi:hypothetical protein
VTQLKIASVATLSPVLMLIGCTRAPPTVQQVAAAQTSPFRKPPVGADGVRPCDQVAAAGFDTPCAVVPLGLQMIRDEPPQSAHEHPTSWLVSAPKLLQHAHPVGEHPTLGESTVELNESAGKAV